jgi:hypothetical protein
LGKESIQRPFVVLRYTHLPLDSLVCGQNFSPERDRRSRRDAVRQALEDRRAADYDFEKAKFLSG